jgi:hypothetical protein
VAVHERHVGDDAAFEHVGVSVELGGRLALGDLGADAGAGVEAGDAGRSRVRPFGQRALRVELDLELTVEVLPGEQLVLTDIGRDHLAQLPVLQQHAEPLAVDAHVDSMTTRSGARRARRSRPRPCRPCRQASTARRAVRRGRHMMNPPPQMTVCALM